MLAIGPDRDLLMRYRTPSGEWLLHLDGWVCSVRGDGEFHALDAEQVLERVRTTSRRRTYDAACGAKVRVWPYPGDHADSCRATALWPPRLATLRNGATRCRDCWEATGRKRPSGYFPVVVPS